LGIGRSTLVELMNAGEVESRRVRGTRLVLYASLQELLARAPSEAGPAKYRPSRRKSE
jgi:hypothetical protein